MASTNDSPAVQRAQHRAELKAAAELLRREGADPTHADYLDALADREESDEESS